MSVWQSEAPEKCDMCDYPITTEFVDGRVQSGHWGILCRKCHVKYGVGLGTGKGQHYVKVKGIFTKVSK